MHTTALICTVVLGVLVFGLGLMVSALRFREKRLHGYSEEPTNLLHRVVRAHGNAVEYAPFLAILFLYLGAHDSSALTVWLIVGATASRVAHAVGLIAWPSMARPNPLRFLGALGTYVCGLALCAVLAGVGG